MLSTYQLFIKKLFQSACIVSIGLHYSILRPNRVESGILRKKSIQLLLKNILFPFNSSNHFAFLFLLRFGRGPLFYCNQDMIILLGVCQTAIVIDYKC